MSLPDARVGSSSFPVFGSEVFKRLRELPWLTLALVGAVVLTSEHYARLLAMNVVDDAVTSMQYAKNLALGNGLVFNVGERVDGYTNFLWVLVMAPFYALSRLLDVEFVPLVVHVNVLIAAAVLWLVLDLARSLWSRHFAVLVAGLFLVIDNSFTTWASLCLETHLLAFLMLLALAFLRSRHARRALLAGFALALCQLTRPDAGLFAACVVGSELVAIVPALWKRDRAGSLAVVRHVALLLAAWLVPYAIYFVWHYVYYGAPFPNTYYVKLGGEIDAWARGLAYVREFFEVRAYVPLLGLIALPALLFDRTLRVLVVYLPLHTLYVVYVGGDFMPGHRFLVPELPQFALLIGAAVFESWRRLCATAPSRWLEKLGIQRAALGGFLATSVLLGLGFLALRQRQLGPIDTAVQIWKDDHTRQKRLMRWVKHNKPPGASFATGLIGHTGFYGDVRVIDTMGIIDKVTARMEVENFGHGTPGHEKAAPVDYILKQKPTYVGIFVLPTNLWRQGYYLDTGVPRDSVPGLWTRDALLERGEYLEATRVRFDGGPIAGWKATGHAFSDWPSRKKGPGQGHVDGAEGSFVNSYHPERANSATGTLTSAPFRIAGDRLVFRLAGGDDPERLQVNLRVGSKVVRTTTGRQSDLMGRRDWDVREFRGELAELEIVDQAVGAWGYLAVDELVEWRARK